MACLLYSKCCVKHVACIIYLNIYDDQWIWGLIYSILHMRRWPLKDINLHKLTHFYKLAKTRFERKIWRKLLTPHYTNAMCLAQSPHVPCILFPSCLLRDFTPTTGSFLSCRIPSSFPVGPLWPAYTPTLKNA